LDPANGQPILTIDRPMNPMSIWSLPLCILPLNCCWLQSAYIRHSATNVTIGKFIQKPHIRDMVFDLSEYSYTSEIDHPRVRLDIGRVIGKNRMLQEFACGTCKMCYAQSTVFTLKGKSNEGQTTTLASIKPVIYNNNYGIFVTCKPMKF